MDRRSFLTRAGAAAALVALAPVAGLLPKAEPEVPLEPEASGTFDGRQWFQSKDLTRMTIPPGAGGMYLITGTIQRNDGVVAQTQSVTKLNPGDEVGMKTMTAARIG